MLKPMQESLAKLSTHSQNLEVKREGAYREVLTEIQNMQKSHLELRKETTQLVQALRAPKVRGNWGEMQLRKCVEFSGMVQYASFEVEKFVKGEDVSIRPDLIVKLPNGRSIIVDAKTPLDAFLDASACEDEMLRSGFMAAHAARVRKHLDALCGKAYWKQFPESPDFVVCFLAERGAVLGGAGAGPVAAGVQRGEQCAAGDADDADRAAEGGGVWMEAVADCAGRAVDSE